MMRECPVCQTSNDDFAIICRSCGGYLQNRVPNLNLFETMWSVFDSPVKAFRRIGLAEHKNHAVLLFGVFGIACAFTLLWLFRWGEFFDSLLTLIAWGTVLGAAFGIALHPVVAGTHWIVAKLLGSRRGYREALGVTAYALSPIVLSVVLILPIELLTFGIYLFTSNPHPYALNPVSYVVLLGLDVAAGLWSVVLLAVGTRIAQSMTVGRALAGSVITAGVIIGLLALVGWEVTRILSVAGIPGLG